MDRQGQQAGRVEGFFSISGTELFTGELDPEISSAGHCAKSAVCKRQFFLAVDRSMRTSLTNLIALHKDSN
jgi:hypothetical protein